MRILMLGNSFTTANDLPGQLAALTGTEVVCHTRGGARLSEHLNPGTRLGARTQAALAGEHWDYVVLQEMSLSLIHIFYTPASEDIKGSEAEFQLTLNTKAVDAADVTAADKVFDGTTAVSYTHLDVYKRQA